MSGVLPGVPVVGTSGHFVTGTSGSGVWMSSTYFQPGSLPAGYVVPGLVVSCSMMGVPPFEGSLTFTTVTSPGSIQSSATSFTYKTFSSAGTSTIAGSKPPFVPLFAFL